MLNSMLIAALLIAWSVDMCVDIDINMCVNMDINMMEVNISQVWSGVKLSADDFPLSKCPHKKFAHRDTYYTNYCECDAKTLSGFSLKHLNNDY